MSLNKQGEDSGTQYRTGIYYFYDDDIATIEEVFADEQRKYEKKIVTEKGRLRNFYNAEDYHQDYLKKNPQGYCHIDFSSLNDLKEDKKQFVDPDKYQAPDRETLKTKLSAQAYEVTQHAALILNLKESTMTILRKVFTLILLQEHHYLSQQINTNPDAVGLLFQSQLMTLSCHGI